jgi:hypothetical protein
MSNPSSSHLNINFLECEQQQSFPLIEQHEMVAIAIAIQTDEMDITPSKNKQM